MTEEENIRVQEVLARLDRIVIIPCLTLTDDIHTEPSERLFAFCPFGNIYFVHRPCKFHIESYELASANIPGWKELFL